MATPQNFYNQDIPFSISWAESKSPSTNPLTYLLTKAAPEGTAAKPATVWIDKAVTFPTNGTLTVPVNIVLEQIHDGYINFAGSTTPKLTLVGEGVKNASKITRPLFMNAPVNNYSDASQLAGQANHKGVKWSDGSGTAPMPKEISTEIFGFTADNNLGAAGADISVESLSHRIKRVELAFPLTHKIKVICSPRTVDAQVLLRYNRYYYFLFGKYLNTWNGNADTDITTHRKEPFILHCPKDTRFDMEWELGTEFYLSDAQFHKTLIYPADADNVGEMGYMYYKNVPLYATRNINNGEGTNLIRTGNCQGCEVDGMYLIGVQDYPVTMGGDPRNGYHGKNIRVKNVYMLDNYNYGTHGLNYENGWLEDYLMEVLSLPANKTISAGDEEPNGTEEFLKDNGYRRVFFRTNQGTVVAGDPNRQFLYIHPFCYVAQSAATDGIYNFTYDNCGYECPSVSNGTTEFNSVQSGIIAEGHYNLKINDFDANGGGANGLFRLERCRKAFIYNPKGQNIYSGKILLIGTGEITVHIDENKVSSATGKKIVEMEWGHPVLVNGNEWRMIDYWGRAEGRVYKWYAEQGGWKFDYMNQTANAQTYTTTKNITNYPFKRLTVNVSVGTKTALTMSSLSGNTWTNSGHGLTTGEPLDYSSSGVMFNELKDSPYSTTTYPYTASEPRRVYAIVVNSNEYKLATTIRNAFAGTAISGFTGGSGTHFLTRFYLTGKSFLPAAVDLTNNRINVPNHNLVKGAAVQYRNYDTSGNDTATAIGGLLKASTNENLVTKEFGGVPETWFGFYYVFPDPSDPTNYLKFAEDKEKALAEVAIDLSGTTGTGFHYIIPLAMTDNSETNSYFLPKGWTVERRNPLSKSRVFYHQNWRQEEIGVPAAVTDNVSRASDTVPERLVKLENRIAASEDPPIWMADRFYSFRAESLLGSVPDATAVEILPNSLAGGTFLFNQPTAGLRGIFYHADENGMPYVLVTNEKGYLGNENFPDLTAGFAFAIKGKYYEALNEGYYMSALNNNMNSSLTPNDATWNFSFTYNGQLRWWNSGIIADQARVNAVQLILGTTGATSKIFKDGVEITEDGSFIAKPARLNIGDPYSVRNAGAGCRIYWMDFWDKNLDADTIAAYNSDNAV